MTRESVQRCEHFEFVPIQIRTVAESGHKDLRFGTVLPESRADLQQGSSPPFGTAEQILQVLREACCIPLRYGFVASEGLLAEPCSLSSEELLKLRRLADEVAHESNQAVEVRGALETLSV